jgi:hydroxymethylpyrimidine/phosphomethylpyrimidine kinase
MSTKLPPACLTIGSSDSSGGAGIQADLKTFTALNVYGASVVTSLTAQDFTSIRGVHVVPESFVRAQLEAVEDEIPFQAVKVGLCPSAGSMRVIARWLRARPSLRVVVDPVAADARGVALLQPDVIETLKNELLPRATICTPNRFEAALLAGMEECLTIEDMAQAAREILRRYGCAAVVTGGGMSDRSYDVLAAIDGIRHFDAETIVREKVHGAGCAHSAAITANLASGESVRESIINAKAYVSAAIAAAPELENRHSVLWHGVTVGEQVMARDASGSHPVIGSGTGSYPSLR